MDKEALTLRYRVMLDETAAALEASLAQTREGMQVGGDRCPQNRGERAAVTGQGYLAQGVTRRLAALRDGLGLLDQVAAGPRDSAGPGALVELEDERGTRRLLLILPGAQGQVIDGVHFVSPSSPMGRALRGLGPEEEVTVRGAPWTIRSVR